MMTDALQNWRTPKGEVYLVGAGPGDPELLTLKALRLMQQADVVIYDRLVSAPIMELCRRDADKVYVGKARSNHSVPQEGINELLVKYAQAGKRVCRLKGGDPFIFGRGGEEIQELLLRVFRFRWYLALPLLRDARHMPVFHLLIVTMRRAYGFNRTLKSRISRAAMKELVYENQTLVLYMGLVGLEQICEQLIEHGQRPDMPVALISKGTTPEQKLLWEHYRPSHRKYLSTTFMHRR